MKQETFQIKITLRDSQPAIWRRILVSGDMTFRVFHRVLQEVMGWENAHSHRFTFKKQDYGRQDDDAKIKNDAAMKLSAAITGKGQCFIYEYDFGDSWEHYCIVEKVLTHDDSKTVALCIDGERACPPEDVGGIPGYQEFLDAACHPNHISHKEMMDWVGGAFDPAAFDLNNVNKRLQRITRTKCKV